MKRFTRRPRPALEVAPGERLLAWAETDRGPIGGTRDAFYAAGAEPVRVPWEQIEAADWDMDAGQLTVTEVGQWGQPRPEHVFALAEPGTLLQLVRERVTASVVLQRHVAVHGRRGVRVIARRAPHGTRPLAWFFAYDAGVDPADPEVRQAAGEAMAAAQSEVGEG